MAKQDDHEEEETTTMPVNDAWTGMLIVSFLALSVGSGFLAWDYYQYSDTDPPKDVRLKYLTPPSAPGNKEQPKQQPPPQDKKEDAKPEDKKIEDKKEEKKEDKKEGRLFRAFDLCTATAKVPVTIAISSPKPNPTNFRAGLRHPARA